MDINNEQKKTEQFLYEEEEEEKGTSDALSAQHVQLAAYSYSFPCFIS